MWKHFHSTILELIPVKKYQICEVSFLFYHFRKWFCFELHDVRESDVGDLSALAFLPPMQISGFISPWKRSSTLLKEITWKVVQGKREKVCSVITVCSGIYSFLSYENINIFLFNFVLSRPACRSLINHKRKKLLRVEVLWDAEVYFQMYILF